MDLTDLRQKPHLSASAINDYCDCGLLYKFSRIDQLKPESKSAELVMGSSIHSVLAEFYKELAQRKKLTAGQLEEIFEAHWRFLAKDSQEIQYKPDKNYETHLSEGKNLLTTFHQNLQPDEFNIIGVEQTFSFMLDGLAVPIIGVYDLILEDESGVITIVDHKTSSKSYSNAEVDKNLQMTIYHLSAKANGYADREILLRLDCLIKTKTPKFNQFYTVRSEADEIKAAKKIIAVWEAINKRVFIPNPHLEM